MPASGQACSASHAHHGVDGCAVGVPAHHLADVHQEAGAALHGNDLCVCGVCVYDACRVRGTAESRVAI